MLPKMDSTLNPLDMMKYWRCLECGKTGQYMDGEYRNPYEAHPICQVATPEGDKGPRTSIDLPIATCPLHGRYNSAMFASCPDCPARVRGPYHTPITDRATDQRITPEPVRNTMRQLERERAQLIELLADVVEKDQAAITELARLGCPLCPDAIKSCGERREKLSKYRLTALE